MNSSGSCAVSLATAGIPILAASGDVHLAADADAVISKPYKWERLTKMADGLLREGRVTQ